MITMLVMLGLAIWFVVWGIKKGNRNKERLENLTPTERLLESFGALNHAMVCPHCQTAGKIHTKPFEKKAGISGGKAAAAVITGGVSILATGLSRTEGATQAHCEECKNTWTF